MRTFYKAKTLKRLFYLCKDLKTRETTGHRALGGRGRGEKLSKNSKPQDYNSRCFYSTHIVQKLQTKKPWQNYSSSSDTPGTQSRSKKNTLKRYFYIPNTMRFSQWGVGMGNIYICVCVYISPANIEFTIKKCQSP